MSNTQLNTVPSSAKKTLIKGIAFAGALVLLFQFQPFSRHTTLRAKPARSTCIYASNRGCTAQQAPVAQPEQFKICRPTAVETQPAAQTDDSAELHLFSFPVWHTDMASASVEEQPAAVRQQYAFLPALVRVARNLFGARAQACE